MELTSRKKKIIVASIAGVTCLGIAGFIAWPYISGWGSMDSVQQYKIDFADDGEGHIFSNVTDALETMGVIPSDTSEEASGPFTIDWNGLQAANPDVVGWINVPGTNIDYPIVQAHPEDPEHYLHYDFNNNYSYYGCPYVDSNLIDIGRLDNAFPIMYGHSLINGTMFSQFQKFSSYDFAAQHRTINIYTPDGDRKLRVIGVNIVDANVELIEVGYQSSEGLYEYMSQKMNESEVVLEPLSSDVQRVYAFVCCSYQSSNARTIVYAVDDGEVPHVWGNPEEEEPINSVLDIFEQRGESVPEATSQGE